MKPVKFFLILLLLIGCLDNINAQQPVDKNQHLDAKKQNVVTISAFAAKGDLSQLNQALNNGLDAGLTVNEVKEILVHLYAYAGFPRSLNAISTLEGVVNERKQKGLRDVTGKAPGNIITAKTKFQVGNDVQTKLTGSTATGAPQKFVPVIDTFLKEHLFADIFSRDIFDYKTREIITISALAALGGTENQLRSHFNVGLNTGLTEAQLKTIVTVLQEKVGSKEGNTADEVLQSILSKTGKVRLVDSSKVSVKTIFPKGTRITNNNFTGATWLQMLVNNDTTFNSSVGHVTFEPGARTNWHYHPGGQILLVTNGIGRYQEKGKPVREIRTGDVIKCEPNTMHWHGASPASELSHVTLGTNPNSAPVVWLKPVADEEYNNLNN